MNQYYQNILDFQDQIKFYLDCIFKECEKKLLFQLGDCNLLQNESNCIVSSTAIGYALEEFVVSKLEEYTHRDGSTKYKIDRIDGATSGKSYDCFSYKENGCKFLINVKTQKKGAYNNAIAAITQLYKDYCLDDSDKEKSFVLLKIFYSIDDAIEKCDNKLAKTRLIHIDDVKSFCLEEVDFSEDFKQDNRSWSKENKKNSGRLVVSQKFRSEHKVDESDISYKKTFEMLKNLFEKNK